MKKIKLYIAQSLDGYIARKDGSLDWLESIPNPNKLDYGYEKFFRTIDTVIMGRVTYQEILGFGVGWPYADCHSYVVSSSKDLDIETPKTYLLGNDWDQKVRTLKSEEGNGIWLVGGGRLISGFLKHQLIDEITLTIVPIILGEGIPLFPDHPSESKFKLIDCQAFETGLVNINYISAETQ